MTYPGNITDLKQLHYMFDGKRKFNSGFVGRDKVKEMILAVLRDNPIGIYDKNQTLFGQMKDQNGFSISTNFQFEAFVNDPLFNFNHPVLSFVNVY